MTRVLLLTLVAGLVAGAGRTLHRRAVARRRVEAIERASADVADLLIVVLGSGAGVLEGLRWVAEHGPGPTRPAFTRVLERCAGGQPLAAALRVLPDELGDSYCSLVVALTAAVRDGTPTSALLLRLGDEARVSRRRDVERTARSLAVHLLFPLVVCSLPSVVIGAVLPLVLVAVGRL